MTTLWTLIAAERRALADDLADLADADWEARSLCTDWTIRDVVAHLTSWARLTPGPFLRSLVFHGFNLKSTMAEDMTRAAGASIQETLDNVRSVQDFVRPVPGGGAVSMLGETVVHAEDIRRPLGIQRSYPTEALTLIADSYARSNYPIGAKTRVAGLALRATDAEWRHGTGLPVEGPLSALVVAMAGRPAALADLTGEGLAQLESRSGADTQGATR